MAYPTRQRDPLLDSDMAAAIERRSKELIGIVLLVLSALAAMMVWSYSPDDPNWMVSTDAPVQNWLGRMGASLAGMLFTIVGWGSAALALILGAWGVRFVLHLGGERALGRLIFAPIWVATFAIYAATLQPGSTWLQTHSFGLGGLFGDMVMGFILTVLPLGSAFAVKVMSFVMALAIVGFGAFVLGFSRIELRAVLRWLLRGLVVTYAALMGLLGRSARASMTAAHKAKARKAQQREAAQMQAEAAWSEDADFNTEPPLVAPEIETPEPKQGLLSRMPSLIKRPETAPDMTMPELEMADTEFDGADIDAPDDARVQTRIADAIKARVRAKSHVRSTNAAPLTRGRGHGPQPLIADAVPGMRSEPPLTAPMTQVADAARDPVLPSVPPAPVSSMPNTDPMDAPLALMDDEAPAFLETTPPPVAPSIPVAEPRRVVQQPARKVVKPSSRAKAEAQPTLFDGSAEQDFALPPLALLSDPGAIVRHHLSDDALEENARMLENVLDDYGVKGEIVSVRPGPVVTMYELEPAPGLKASRVIGLADDIARSMAALSARVSTVPGRSVIGIELPNENREKVVLREILSARDYGDGNQKLPLALGKDIGGDSVVANLAKMPHLLIAGTTGSGKSVAINTMILSLLYKLTPEDCRLIMIDPKMLELSVYDGIPHLLSPVVTDPKKAVVALKWVVGEMEERYRKMSKMGVRNIDGYNGRVKDALAKGELFSRT
ncbi:MAG: DNA translocase FtsK 4TM domain-containing protein, partial [Paracoccaceae bacterium]